MVQSGSPALDLLCSSGSALEYLQHLQTRAKWRSPSRNVAVGDVVVLKEETPLRNQWILARVIQACPSSDGLVRRVILQLGAPLDAKGKPVSAATILERPVTKVVVLVESRCEPL